MADELKAWRRSYCVVAVPLYLTLIFGIPCAVLVGSWMISPVWVKPILALLAPLVYSLLFCASAGLLSTPHRKGIISGKFPRDVRHPVYFHRRLYGLCWTSLYYFKPVYYLALTIPSLKTLTFRLFGYRGQMEFTVYPDTWIRDLPLLTLGKGAYIANRSTLGTNLALRDGQIQVGAIEIGAGSVIGHLCALAPDCSFGEGSELGATTRMGFKNKIGSGVSIGPGSAIEHGVQIGDNASIGASTYIGSASRVAPGLSILPGSVIPPRSRLTSEEDSGKYAPYLHAKSGK